VNITDVLSAYLADVKDEHDREWSWVYCYRYFKGKTSAELAADRDHAALQLAFYLASWGMYRPSSFLFQHAYTVHLPVIDALLRPEFGTFWNHEFGSDEGDEKRAALLLEAGDRIRSAYRPFGAATDTLVSKVLLGTYGCLPAVDTYFDAGYKLCGFRVPGRLNAAFVQELVRFCRHNLSQLQGEQARIERVHHVRYPLMKLVDMCFHQIGIAADAKRNGASA
jgi:hypothetical protein